VGIKRLFYCQLRKSILNLAMVFDVNTTVRIQLIPGAEAVSTVDPFYEQEGKNHRARNSDLFFAAFARDTIVGVCRFCIEENTPLLRSMIIHAPLRSKKIGAKILESFALYLDANNFRPTYCVPYNHLEKFYGLIGFKIIKEENSPLFLQNRIQDYRKNSSNAYMIMRRD
jgi:N-acetylglutamate synthase-like GNAT family acetyltransferase